MKFSLFLFMSIFLFTACRQKEGCTDVTAVNYDVEASIDNGTCKYCDHKESGILGRFIPSDNSADFELELDMDSFPAIHQGCSLTIDLHHFFPPEETNIQWSPAEIFDCSSCLEVIMTPITTTEVTLQIDNKQGYYLKATFEAIVL